MTEIQQDQRPKDTSLDPRPGRVAGIVQYSSEDYDDMKLVRDSDNETAKTNLHRELAKRFCFSDHEEMEKLGYWLVWFDETRILELREKWSKIF